MPCLDDFKSFVTGVLKEALSLKNIYNEAHEDSIKYEFGDVGWGNKYLKDLKYVGIPRITYIVFRRVSNYLYIKEVPLFPIDTFIL